ncbi:methyltransferase [Acetobacter senegalensis]|uniref:Methyltransferase n=1 Tax=Acetobacter senegalensis TaxID=446692 RepID=A0A149TW12_9PROT|nr:16S rRNA (guanine(966)-N(2))-methyltransferase RsmD [Acetobacter senegalensis]KXV57404.1 methyltransferase [Acetobacter senegalensis]
MRIIAGARKGRVLAAPQGTTTRPTADRVRQALFDMLLHAPWGGSRLLDNAHVLDAFAGTGALALEALSRGAAQATFFETDRAALAALRANIAGCGWQNRCKVFAKDVTSPPRAAIPCSLLFLDPPYRQNLPARTLAALKAQGWIAPHAIAVIETSAQEPLPLLDIEQQGVSVPETDDPLPVFSGALLAERKHGAARISVWRIEG